MLNLIILVRHGQSQKDKRNPKRGLTAKGRAQVKFTAKKILPLIKGRKCVLVSSPTNRTIQTGKILGKLLDLDLFIEKESLRVANIDKLKSRLKPGADLTLLYFEAFERRELPRTIPSPKEMAQKFIRITNKFKDREVLILAGHSGALESFAKYQDMYITKNPLSKEIGYGNFVVLTRYK